VDFPLSGLKVGKQFAAAEAAGAARAVVVGGEWPEVRLKTLSSREEVALDANSLFEALKE